MLAKLLALALAWSLGFSSEVDAPPLRPEGFDYPRAGSRAGLRVMKQLERLEREVVTSEYAHRRRIDRTSGHFAWDCSAMVNYVLARAAPGALEALGRKRPVASTYARTIRKATTRRRSEGAWLRIRKLERVRPGDVFAWEHPPDFPSPNTGHVGFVLSAPRTLPDRPGAYLVRILDASSYTHQDDTRDPDGPGGYGAGTLLFVTDADGEVRGYGWRGEHSHVREVAVHFGRVRE